MKKTIFSILLLMATATLFAQPLFDLGFKGGINNSKISIDFNDYNSESITKAHIGVFGRIGWGRVFVQPEVYFSAKGGDLSSSVINTATSFDYSTVDIPVLLGFRIIKGGLVDFHATLGPVFSFITSAKTEGEFDANYFADNYVGLQYGLGLDIWFITLDARMEYAGSNLYQHPEFDAKNQMFMLSVGFKIL
jgi:hypothetical protein